ncbi:YlaH-like family protein [Paenibacillus tarimensis]|uniref:YlaH-like family protein n=1 Tax=Paenibacillus tarimensis TaxID=416012 RepID=UPI001F1FCBAF|nr:YlaH-like family protein [Paenibacillus tarimensis]MCF2942090.1 YlaH-like family protein [Paenibacillus tarimensis]
MQQWFSDHKLISYLLILGFTIYIFNKVFRAQQKLPILKEILVYILMAFGSGVLLIMQVDKLPIIQCMGVAVLMMLIHRGRQLYDKWKDRSAGTGRDAMQADKPIKTDQA